MKGQVVLVTGASGGLGTYVTQAFLGAGATVIGTSRKIQQTDFTSPAFAAVSGEISTQTGATALLNTVVERFGRLDVLAHTVGGFAGGQPVVETDDATFQRMFDLNLNSFFYILRASIPALRRSGRGRAKTVAAENRDAGVTANVILPGTMDTTANRAAMPGSDFSKWVQPANIASLTVWLASEAARDINGAVIPVYGNV